MDDDDDVSYGRIPRHSIFVRTAASCLLSDANVAPLPPGYKPEERRALLKFVTSSSRPPVQGFKHLHPPFTIHKVNCEAPSVFSFMTAGRVLSTKK